ncbi:hypothetical protein NQD34_015214 [Periophthalmus magnuspinnatus]|nr:hypothetical protein NQD34_015214 [Periophthalmus magnuspinnatus]
MGDALHPQRGLAAGRAGRVGGGDSVDARVFRQCVSDVEDEIIQTLMHHFDGGSEGQRHSVLLPLQCRLSGHADLKAHVLALATLHIGKETLEHGSKCEVSGFGPGHHGEPGFAAVISVSVTSHNTVLSVVLFLQAMDDQLVQAFVADKCIFLIVLSRDHLLARFVPDDTGLGVHGDGDSGSHVLSEVGCLIDEWQCELGRFLQQTCCVNATLCLLHDSGCKEVSVTAHAIDEELSIGAVLSVLVHHFAAVGAVVGPRGLIQAEDGQSVLILHHILVTGLELSHTTVPCNLGAAVVVLNVADEFDSIPFVCYRVGDLSGQRAMLERRNLHFSHKDATL